jgi:hypothetical protein
MDRTPTHPRLQKAANLLAAYTLFILLAFMGILLTLNLHNGLIHLCVVLNARYQVAYAVRVWGAFLLFLVYIFLTALMEPYLHNGARTGRVFRRGLTIFLIECGIWLLAFVLSSL